MNMIDNINDIDDIPKKSLVKIKKIRYKKERKEILDKIYEIIGINENNKIFYTHEIDLDENKKQKIEELIPEIKKNFSVSSWICLNNSRKMNKKHVSIVRYILKDMLIDYSSMPCKMKKNDKFINTTQYNII